MEIQKELKDIVWQDFKPIPKLESYAASKDGRIIALPKIREGDLQQLNNMKNRTDKAQRFYKAHIIKQAFKQRYYYVNLTQNGVKKDYRVHRLIYKTYKGDIPNGMVIDHIDGNTKNNNIDNLRCVSQSENCSNKNTIKNQYKAVIMLNKDTNELIKEFESIIAAEMYFGKHYSKGLSSHIGECCNGYRETCHGYKWKWK